MPVDRQTCGQRSSNRTGLDAIVAKNNRRTANSAWRGNARRREGCQTNCPVPLRQRLTARPLARKRKIFRLAIHWYQRRASFSGPSRPDLVRILLSGATPRTRLNWCGKIHSLRPARRSDASRHPSFGSI